MVLGLNNFGLLGDKNQGFEKVNALFQKLDERRKLNLVTTNGNTVIAQQVFLPNDVAGVYLFRVTGTGWNATDATGVAAAGYVGATVNNAGDVTIIPGVADTLLGIKNVAGGAAATFLTATAQDASGTTPAAVNINVVGTAAKTIYWNVTVDVVSYSVNNPNQSPVGNERVTSTPPLT
jgi:hypothetical protein